MEFTLLRQNVGMLVVSSNRWQLFERALAFGVCLLCVDASAGEFSKLAKLDLRGQIYTDPPARSQPVDYSSMLQSNHLRAVLTPLTDPLAIKHLEIVTPITPPQAPPQLRSSIYSSNSGFSYQFSPRTQFNVAFDRWSVQLGMTRSLPPPESGPKTQNLW